MGAKRLPKEADMGYFPYSVVYRSKRHAKDSPRADTRNCRCGFEKFTLCPGGVRTTWDALWIQNFQDGGEGREISQVICFIFQ